jgi:hypothetical protein
LQASDNEKEKIRHYLLGRLDPDVSRLEERLMTESSLYEELIILEDELIDLYIRDQMSADDRTSFEAYFLRSPERRQKLRFAKAFNKYVDLTHSATDAHAPGFEETPPPVDQISSDPSIEELRGGMKRFFTSLWPIRHPGWGYGLAAALALTLAIVAWFVWPSLRNPSLHQPSAILSVTLTPGLSRDTGRNIKEVTLPAGTDILQLQLLLLENQYSSYEAVLTNYNGQTITAKSDLRLEPVTGHAIPFDIPANLLVPDDYRVKLSGITANGNREVVNSYSFKVLPR